ncbi:YheC/YheD family protein [Halobacillus halophilus]|uniref:YheC/YheD family protein n=1 Tax=Halobacillus halophilus TaxID=1570 RepID=UPI001CD7B6D5|nr:YheC/YheD family protein [Halobacillus halophilus]MCA1011483.1 YheC/YheD family protein [Halobacillus halophilus]
MEKEYIGVILPNGIYQLLSEGKSQINVRAYQEAGEHYHFTPVFMRLKGLQPGVDYVEGFIKKGETFELETVELPKVIYTRSFLSKKQKRFLEDKKVQFYNKKGIGHDKYKMHQIISENPDLIPFLPETEKASLTALEKMMNQYDRLILKPAKGSLGGGIMKLSRSGPECWHHWHLKYPVARREWSELTFTTFKDGIPEVIREAFEKKPYIIQRQIELATYQERPFDLRIVAQRNHTGNWVVAGMLCKVSPSKDQFVTNISQGGSSLDFDKVLKAHPYLPCKKTKANLANLTLKLAQHLEHYTDHIADIAFDFALDTSGHPYFIESNFRGRYGNVKYKGKRYEEWKAKHFNPIGYGRYLYNKIKDES